MTRAELDTPPRELIGGAEVLRSFVVWGCWVFPAAVMFMMLVVDSVGSLSVGGNPGVLLAFWFPLAVVSVVILPWSVASGLAAGVLVQVAWFAGRRSGSIARRGALAIATAVLASVVIWSFIPVPWVEAPWARWVGAALSAAVLATRVVWRVTRLTGTRP